ncbi:MAG: signal peptidase II [Firmicutes bacterium]|nr:signal peptidase II [Bacillota bacterium]
MIALIIVVLLILSDQLTKLAALEFLAPIKQRVLIEGFFNLTYVENRGAAFGAMQGARWFFVVLAALVVAGLAFYYYRMEKTKKTLPLRIAIVLIVGGTVGNVIDRVFRGYVVDFLDFIVFGYDFPVFNAADVFIVVGTVFLAAYILLVDLKREDKK